MTDEILDELDDSEPQAADENAVEATEPAEAAEESAVEPADDERATAESHVEEPAAETVVEPAVEAEAEPVVEPAAELEAGPTAETAVEPAAEPAEPFWRRWIPRRRPAAAPETPADAAVPDAATAPEVPATPETSATPEAAGPAAEVPPAEAAEETALVDYGLWDAPAQTPAEAASDAASEAAPVSENDPTLFMPVVEAPYPVDSAPTELLPVVTQRSADAPQLIKSIPVPGAEEVAPLGAPSEIDMGPERRANSWVWIGVAVGVILMAGAIGYAWWYTTGRSIAVPNVVGKQSAQAAQVINDSDLRLGKVSQVPTDSAPVGTVIEQNPSAYSSLKPGESVALVVAANPDTAKVPDVSGRTSEEAVATLASERLAARVVESYSPTVAVGFVVAQLPTSTTEVDPGSVVVLAVSKGVAPATQRVPGLAGLGEADATALLSPLGFRSVTVRSYSASVPAGIVMSQTPAPDMQVARNTVVLYSVSAGIGLTTGAVPNITGQKSTAANNSLKQLGLKAQVAEMSSATVPKGTVISQMPPAAARIQTGGAVVMLVSTGAATSTVVPSLIGRPSDEASKTATGAGYDPIFVEVKASSAATGTVFAQWPPAGAMLPVPASIIALVAKL